jgi:hypothetical protein
MADLLYLLKCVKYTDDVYWKNVFEEMGINNRFPSGVFIRGNHLVCAYPNKNFFYLLDSKKQSDILFKEIKDLFQNRLGLKSPTELIQLKSTIEFDYEIKKINSWRDVSKKYIKDILIEEFAINNMKQYDLTVSQTRRLIDTINMLLSFKIIGSDNISILNGVILDIEGFSFELHTFNATHSNDMLENATIKIQAEHEMSENWNKFLNRLKKQ